MMRRLAGRILPAAAFLAVLTTFAYAEPAFDPKPWLDDLAQTREVFLTKYANLEWAVFDRESDLPGLFDDTRKRIEAAQSDIDARAAFDRLARRLGDGHVVFVWPVHGAPHGDAAPSLPCADYTSAIVSPSMVARVAGYRPIEAKHSDLFPIGTIGSGKHRVGVMRIGLFEPQGFPQLCQSALAALSIPADKPCDDACDDRITNHANTEMSEAFVAQLEALMATKPDALLVDITRNGGGNDWAEAAARMLTAVRLKSERLMFVRGEHWAKHFADLETDLRKAADGASPADRAQLLAWADEAAAKKTVAATPCDPAPLWKGERAPCRWLGEGFYATGLLASGDADSLRGKPWAEDAFTPTAFPYREGIWRGPLVVVVDGNTGSAAEEFAAELQDNHAELIVGEPTVGAGCGHTDGGTPTMLKNSRAILQVPDCARFRADGTNEVRGILPDVLIGWRKSDGPNLRADAFLAQLRHVVEQAGSRRNAAAYAAGANAPAAARSH